MNYIKHISHFYRRVSNEPRLTALHISLYMAVFQRWNAARFQNPFHVSRQEILELARIGSVNTYHRCLKDLHDWRFLEYFPSKSISAGSRIRCITFDTSTDTTTDTTGDTTDELPVRHYNKHNKHDKHNQTIKTLSLKEVADFFEKEGYDQAEASKFFNHYEANGWMMGSAPVKSWQASAIKWMANVQNFSKGNNKIETAGESNNSAPKAGNLFVNTQKNYDEKL